MGEVTIVWSPSGLVAALALASTLVTACTDNREAITRDRLRKEIASESQGSLSLTTMRKSNGFVHERDGMKLYTLEWEIDAVANANGWKAGWADYRLLPTPPNAFAAAAEGFSVTRIVKGTVATLVGKSELQKADRGWRVLGSEVTKVRLALPPPGAEFLGDWIGYRANSRLEPFETNPSLRMRIAREGERFKITQQDMSGSPWSWIAEHRDGKLVDVAGFESELTDQALTLEVMSDFSLKEVNEGIIRYVSSQEPVKLSSPATHASPTIQSQALPPRAKQTIRQQGLSGTRIGPWMMPEELTFLSSRRVSKDELRALDRSELRQLRNFIYARHGRRFDSSDLRGFFEREPWYHADPAYSESRLSSVEIANVATIAELEGSLR